MRSEVNYLPIEIELKNHCEYKFCEYCEVCGIPESYTSMKTSIHEGITLGTTGNLQLSYKCILLIIGKKLTLRQSTPIPMSDFIIKKVEVITNSKNGVIG